jgi:uncharacterized protein (DUF342 family)
MVDFIQLQDIIKVQLTHDRNVKTVSAKGPTLQEAVEQAATILNMPVRHLEYEVAERGSTGFMGTGKKDWVINAYERIIMKDEIKVADAIEENGEAAPVIEDKDGDAFVCLSYEGVLLKVVPPKGKGKKISERETLGRIQERRVTEINEDIVHRIVSEAKGVYTKICDFQNIPMNNSTLTIDIAEGEMKAFVTVTPPGIGGYDILFETYKVYLQSSRVVHGIDEEFLKNFIDRPVYNERVAIAEGTKPVNGQDAYIDYHFETDASKVKLKEGDNGRVDFKDLNIIQNVVANQELAKKIPPQQGVPGKTVTGKIIPAKNGKDIPLPVGENVHVGEEGDTLIANINGQVILANGKLNVEPVYVVDGHVNLKTGNIIFLGTVMIKGNVEDGFSVKASGNIEVMGTVEKAELDAEGDVIVHQGITGKSGGKVKAGGSILARFIENSVIEAGNMVIVSDGIINSQVDAYKRIICQGKRAHIVGGRLRASEEINAKTLGSPTSGTSTICEVGIDPKSKMQLEALALNKEGIDKKIEELQRNIQTLVNIKKQRKTLPEDKEKSLQALVEERQTLLEDLKRNQEEMMKIQELLSTIKTRGRVSASSKVYGGVRVCIRDVVLDVNTEYRATTFILEGGLVKISKYEEPDEEAAKGLDGYAAN